MLSKNKFKLIKSLASKKERSATGLFVAEGDKLVSEILNSSFHVNSVVATEKWLKQNENAVSSRTFEKIEVSQEELNKLSFLKTPQEVLCVVRIHYYEINVEHFKRNLSLVLDTIQDPGNLGTILRIADWFGIEQVICTPGTADVFNPKVVQSTMGAICRVKVYYHEPDKILPMLKSLGLPVYGTTLKGENIYETLLPSNGVIVMGNESKGIDSRWLHLLDKQLFIPFYPVNKQRSESLNVAAATAIICSEFRRRSNLLNKGSVFVG